MYNNDGITTLFSDLAAALRLPENQESSESLESSETVIFQRNQRTDPVEYHPSSSSGQRTDSIGQRASSSENQRTDFSRQSRGQAGSNDPFIPSIGLKLDDIIASFKPFKGDNHSNFEKWLLQFEEQCSIFHLSEMQKFIFAKRVLKGIAKSFVEHESSAVTWRELKAELRNEFNQPVNSLLVHQKLSQRKKKPTESHLEYLYEMLELGSQGCVDVRAILTHTINGIPGPAHMKTFLFDAKNVREFEDKLKSFEVQQNQMQLNQPQQNTRRHEDRGAKNETKDRCFNCGDKSHDKESCPNRDKGPKCFRCDSYGHMSRECSVKSMPKKRINVINESKKKRVRKSVLINGFHLTALIDSGSDITTISEEMAARYNIAYDHFEETVQGVGGFDKLLGKFKATILIDNLRFDIDCYVLSSENINEEAIVGLDILDLCEVLINRDGVKLSWPEKKEIKTRSNKNVPKKGKQKSNRTKSTATNLTIPSDDMKATINTINKNVQLEIQRLNGIHYIGKCEQNLPDLRHISNTKIRNETLRLIEGYAPTNEHESPVEMEIVLTDENPVSMKARRLPLSEKLEIEKQINEWLENDIIQHSYSDFSAPVLVVPKKDGSKRICVDYRKLNLKVIKDRFPVPNLEDQLDQLENGRVFTTLDLENGYFHVPIKPGSRKYTSFVTHQGQYEFKRVPFGLCNSPAIFCRFINFIFQPLINEGIVKTYLDDLVVVSKDDDEAIKNLKRVLDVAASYNLRIKWKKCKFMERRIEFLGVEIENGTLRSSPSKTKDVNKYQVPRNAKEVQRFLGFAGYFRKFIENYVTIAKPLSDLTRKDATFQFGPDQLKSFETLKQKIQERPVLQIYNRDAETELHTDASKFGTAAILMQRSFEDHEFHPVYFISNKTSREQEKWFSYELEMYAIKLAVSRFRHYLLDINFTIVTDCEALKTAMSKSEVRKIAGWLMELQEFNFKIVHRAGSKMQHVDALSRMYVINMPGLLHNFQRAQNTDDHIQAIREVLKVKPYEDYVIHNKLLCKFNDFNYKIVVPAEMQMNLILKIHQDGHFKTAKLEKIISKDYFIPNLHEKNNNVIANCVECILADRKDGKKEGFLHPIPKNPIPLDTLHLDHLGPMPSSNKDYKNILAIIDAFTKFV